VAKHTTVNERRNPLGPQALGEAFSRAIEDIELDIKIRIILLKLFERMVMQRMGPVYEEANRALTDAGVLKDLRRTLGKGRNPRTAQGPRPPASAGARGTPGHAGQGHAGHGHGTSGRPGYGAGGYGSAGAAGGGYASSQGGGYGTGGGEGGGYGHTDGSDGFAGGGFGTIQSLLANVRGPEPDEALHAQGGVIATPQLVNLLNAVQSESGREPMSIEEMPSLVDLRHVVVSRAPDVTGEAMNHLGRADEDVVNFIGMLFDYILNDRNLAIPMKALIARLQIPVVKLAIIDKSFFDRSSHPARQLLNELSSAGIGWSSAAELKRDAVYDKIESIVVRVLNGFTENPEIFAELLDELRAFRTQDAARNARMEQRVKETESGKARTLSAKQDVQRVINQKACGLRLPREIGRFLSDVWSRVLVYAVLTEGDDGASWEDLMSTLDDLLWAVQPLDDLADVNRRDDQADALLYELEAGMALIQTPDTDIENWREVVRSQLEEISRNDRAYLEDDDSTRQPEAFPEMEEIVLAAPQEVTDSFEGEAPAPDFVEKINRLSEGNWVEIRQEDRGEPMRCKLATIVKPGDRYVFVNRRGMKVAERTRMELARDLQDDRLVVLNDSQVFDRALQAVIGNLRQIQSEARH
jgi:hypothetical protein